jgi:hypothetical protein
MKKISPYLIPSCADIFFIILFVSLSLNLGQHFIGDGDTGYHIRAGEYILSNLSIPHQDIFSFLDPSPAWTAHEWLSEVIMFLTHDFLGLTGVVIFFALILSLTYYLFFIFLKRHYDNILLITIMLMFVIASSTIHFLARPHVFSLLFVVIWYYLLDSYQYRNRNYLYFLPLIMLTWVNLHGGFIIGFVLLGTYFSGNLIYYFFEKGMEKEALAQKVKAFFIIGIFCLAASLINPYGYHILLFPFDFVTNKFLIAHVQEFHPTSFQNFHVYKYLFLIMLAILMTSKIRLNLIELFLVLGFTYMSLYSVRNISLFAIIVTPIIIKRLVPIMRESKLKLISLLNSRSQNLADTDKSTRGFLWPGLAFCLVLVLAVSGWLKHSFDPKIFPVHAVNFLKEEYIPGNMFNSDMFGDYIIYHAYPQYQVFFDGRSDMYGIDHMKNYQRVISLGIGWEKVLKRHDIQWIIFNADSLLSRYLLERLDWHLIYADKVAHIYVQDIPEYHYLTEKYREVEPMTYGEEEY